MVLILQQMDLSPITICDILKARLLARGLESGLNVTPQQVGQVASTLASVACLPGHI